MGGYTIERSGCLDFHLVDGLLEDPDPRPLPAGALGRAPDTGVDGRRGRGHRSAPPTAAPPPSPTTPSGHGAPPTTRAATGAARRPAAASAGTRAHGRRTRTPRAALTRDAYAARA